MPILILLVLLITGLLVFILVDPSAVNKILKLPKIHVTTDPPPPTTFYYEKAVYDPNTGKYVRRIFAYTRDPSTGKYLVEQARLTDGQNSSNRTRPRRTSPAFIDRR